MSASAISDDTNTAAIAGLISTMVIVVLLMIVAGLWWRREREKMRQIDDVHLTGMHAQSDDGSVGSIEVPEEV